jgi:hypothetical protein
LGWGSCASANPIVSAGPFLLPPYLPLPIPLLPDPSGHRSPRADMDVISPPMLPGQTAPRGPAPPTASGSSAAQPPRVSWSTHLPRLLLLESRSGWGNTPCAPPTAAAPPTPAKRAKRPGNKAPAPA